MSNREVMQQALESLTRCNKSGMFDPEVNALRAELAKPIQSEKRPEWQNSVEHRLQALEKHSHEPFDFTHLILRLEKLESLAEPTPVAVPDEDKVTEGIAELLLDNGWHDRGDAQWGRLRDILPELCAMLTAAPQPPSSTEASSSWGDLFYEVRDNILNGRGHLEGMLNNDQTNAVLGEIDRLDHECAPAVDVEAVREVMRKMRDVGSDEEMSRGEIYLWADQLTRAIGDET